ncbi:MAG: AraC family transcriptional regulator [Chitinophagaceae bacterium]
MKTRNLYNPFEFELMEVEEYIAREHRNTFFEMVFILEGTGIQRINDHRFPYASDKLFLIFPNDLHGFEVKTPTRFFFIRFNESYLKTQSEEWVAKLQYIFNNHNHLPGCILENITDKPLIRALVEALMREQHGPRQQAQEVIMQVTNTIITIAARNIAATQTASPNTSNGDTSVSLLNYIHANIYQPEKLKAEKIAAHFHVSPTYVSQYFKKQSGESLQQYIINYKLKLLETRLHFTDMRIVEIAQELGFTDESHLNRIFKKYKGITPSEFRKTARSKSEIVSK